MDHGPPTRLCGQSNPVSPTAVYVCTTGLGPLVFTEHAAHVTGNKETKLQELMSIGWFWPIGFTLGVHFLPDLLTMHGVAAKRVEG